MPKEFTSLRFLGTVALCLLVLVAFGWFASDPSRADTYRKDDPAFNKSFWGNEIVRYGGVRAYAEFKKLNADMPIERAHFAAHVIGISLFEKFGIYGLSACDSEFGFGCFHGFFSAAVSAGGESQIKKLDDVCVETYGVLGTGCQHGIGHGILEYAGYARITDALDLCKKETTQVVPLLGCTSGVFMEYFFPLQGTGDALSSSIRPLDTVNPYDPCPIVPMAFQASCYFELGQRFHQLPTDDSMLCAFLQEENRGNCFLGVGVDVARVSVTSEMLSACAHFGNVGEDFCRAGASWGYWSAGDFVSATRACAYNESTKESMCRSRADLTKGRDPNVQNISQ